MNLLSLTCITFNASKTKIDTFHYRLSHTEIRPVTMKGCPHGKTLCFDKLLNTTDDKLISYDTSTKMREKYTAPCATPVITWLHNFNSQIKPTIE